MSLINKASLVITPNAVKESKLYSVIPNTSLGDMSVVRATTATRVNSDGLVELVPYNLLQYSERFAMAPWSLINGATITADTTTAPNGTLTADTLTFNGTAFGQIQQAVTRTTGDVLTLSIWMKSNTLTTIGLYIGNDTSNVTINSFWQRFTITKTITSNAATPKIVSSIAGSVDIWGAQLVEGTSARDYLRTETQLNIPRVDYSLGGCPNILLEPQRTNLISYSDNVPSAYANLSTYVLDSSVLTPANTNKAYKFTPSVLNASILNASSPPENRLWFQVASPNTTFTNSVYVKSVSGSSFNLAIKVVNNSSDTEISSKTINVTNNWQRVSVTGLTNGASAGVRFVIRSEQAVYLWGYQIEQGAYPTSYIPTVASTVTRNADDIFKTGISSLLNPSEGTFYVEAQALANDLISRNITISDATDYNAISIQFGSVSNVIRLDTYGQTGVGTTTNLRASVTVTDTTTPHKILIKWSSLGVFGFVDGVKYTLGYATGTVGGSGIPTALSGLYFKQYWGGAVFISKTKTVQVYKTALTDTECIQLTTL